MSGKKKLSLGMAVALGVGAIIGSGIFVYTGYAIGLSGPGVPIAFVLAALLTVYMTLPSIQLGSAVPATGGSYMYVSRFVHPFFGYVQILNTLIGCLNVVVMSLAFSKYFCALFPAVDPKIPAVTIVLIFTFIAYFGVRMSGRLQQIIVVVLIAALAVYFVGGLGHVNPEYISFSKMFKPLGGFAGLWAAIAIVRYTLQGGNLVLALGNEVENPGRNIPLAFFISTLFTAVIYAVVGYVAAGVAPLEAIANKPLATSAEMFLSGPLLTFFIVGGGMLATLTTLNGSFLIYTNINWAAARDGIWPKVFAKKNKNGVPHIILFCISAIALAVILGGIGLGRVFKIVTVPGLLLSAIYYLPSMLLPKKLPNCHKSAYFKMNRIVTYFVCITSIAISMSLGMSLFKRMLPQDYISMLVFFSIGIVYWFVRIYYLKKKNIDLVANMKGYHETWIEKESSLNNTTISQ